MIRSFRHKGLKQFAETGSTAKLSRDMVKRIANVLRALPVAEKPEDVNLPGFKFHGLRGDKKGRHSVWATGNCRITFAWDGQEAVDVDLKDYHR